MALVPESAPKKAALLHGRWLRISVLVVILLGGFFAIVYLGQPHSAPVKASDTGRKVEPPTTQPAQDLPREPITETAPLRTASSHLAAGSTYLQLSATRRQRAELMIDDLRKKNFEAVVSEIDGKPGLVRVLVGPVADSGVLQLREDLERAGFPGNAAIRRVLAESEPAKPEAVKPELPDPDAVKSLPAEVPKAEVSNRPVTGQTYLEFSATSAQAAGIIADALQEKGFDATASAIEAVPGAFRVLVRPVNDASIDQLRADLERAGFHANAASLRILK